MPVRCHALPSLWSQHDGDANLNSLLEETSHTNITNAWNNDGSLVLTKHVLGMSMLVMRLVSINPFSSMWFVGIQCSLTFKELNTPSEPLVNVCRFVELKENLVKVFSSERSHQLHIPWPHAFLNVISKLINDRMCDVGAVRVSNTA